MLPRNNKIRNNKIGKKKFFFAIFLLQLFLFAIPSVRAENVFIKFYQDHISAVDGHRCPMYPSCSAYASQAIEKHGPVLGWMMSCDRLVRCGRNEVDLSKAIIINGLKFVADPLDTNDFWWFEKEKKE